MEDYKQKTYQNDDKKQVKKKVFFWTLFTWGAKAWPAISQVTLKNVESL